MQILLLITSAARLDLAKVRGQRTIVLIRMVPLTEDVERPVTRSRQFAGEIVPH